MSKLVKSVSIDENLENCKILLGDKTVVNSKISDNELVDVRDLLEKKKDETLVNTLINKSVRKIPKIKLCYRLQFKRLKSKVLFRIAIAH
jgi:hypothetical protein